MFNSYILVNEIFFLKIFGINAPQILIFADILEPIL